MSNHTPPTNDHPSEDIACIHEQIADGLAQAKAGELIDGDEVMQRLHERIISQTDEEAA